MRFFSVLIVLIHSLYCFVDPLESFGEEGYYADIGFVNALEKINYEKKKLMKLWIHITDGLMARWELFSAGQRTKMRM